MKKCKKDLNYAAFGGGGGGGAGLVELLTEHAQVGESPFGK